MGAIIGLLMSLMIQMIRLMIKLIILPLEIAARSGSRSRRRRRTVRRAPVRPRQYRTVAPMPVRPVTPQAPVYRLNPPPGWPPMPYGFTPQPGWQPDPSWPPPPPGWQVWLPANEAARRLDPRRRRRNLIIVGCVVGGLVVLAAIGNLLPKQSGTLTPSMTVAGVASSAPPKPHTVPAKPLPEDLTFTGQVNGTFTRGLNPRPASTKDPNPSTGGFGPYNATQCTNSKDEWEGDLYGNVGGTKISLRLSIATDGTALKVVGTQRSEPKPGFTRRQNSSEPAASTTAPPSNSKAQASTLNTPSTGPRPSPSTRTNNPARCTSPSLTGQTIQTSRRPSLAPGLVGPCRCRSCPPTGRRSRSTVRSPHTQRQVPEARAGSRRHLLALRLVRQPCATTARTPSPSTIKAPARTITASPSGFRCRRTRRDRAVEDAALTAWLGAAGAPARLPLRSLHTGSLSC